MNLIHPKQLLEEKRKSKQNSGMLKEYFIKNPPVLIDYEYHIDYTPELRDILISMSSDFQEIEKAMIVISVLANRDFITGEFKFEVKYMIKESYLTFILIPTKKLT